MNNYDMSGCTEWSSVWSNVNWSKDVQWVEVQWVGKEIVELEPKYVTRREQTQQKTFSLHSSLPNTFSCENLIYFKRFRCWKDFWKIQVANKLEMLEISISTIS